MPGLLEQLRRLVTFNGGLIRWAADSSQKKIKAATQEETDVSLVAVLPPEVT
jgi:hypothetical protein